MFVLNGGVFRGQSSEETAEETLGTPSEWSDLLKIDLTPRKYEIAFILFGAIVAFLVTRTPLPFSYHLAIIFFYNAAKWTGLVMLLSILVIGYKAIRHARVYGKESLKEKETFIRLIKPYWTLDFVFLTFRRCVSILGVIYFFLHLKHVILFIHKANYDLFFWNLDKWLHFGVRPNILMMEALGENQAFAVMMDWLYFKYFDYLLIASMIFLLEIKGRKLAEKYFLAYALVWALGGLGYLVMPTDGPCYAILGSYSTPEEHRVHMFEFPVDENIPDDYARSYYVSKIWIAKLFQERLWEHRKRFLSGEKLPGAFYGIAAMPSLHVAMVTMIMLFLFMANPVLGVLGAIYAGATFIGSVFLQWHYAIDGYIGALMAVVIVKLSCSRFLWKEDVNADKSQAEMNAANEAG